jgi:hypothetical protein
MGHCWWKLKRKSSGRCYGSVGVEKKRKRKEGKLRLVAEEGGIDRG